MLSIFLIWASPAYANKSLRVGVFEVDPLIIKKADGTYKGSVVEVLDFIALNEGWELEYVPCKFADCLLMLESAQVDIMGSISYNAERAQRFDYTSEPFFMDWGQIYVPPGSEIGTIVDLDGKSLAVLRNTIQYQPFMELAKSFGLKIETIFVDNYLDVFRLVEEGKADALMVNRIFGDKNIAKHKVQKTSIIFSPMDIRYAVTKGSHRDVIDAIDRRLAAMKQDKDSVYYAAVEGMYGGDRAAIIPRWVGLSSAIALGLIIAFAALSYELRRQVRLRTRQLTSRNEELTAEVNERKLVEQELIKSRKQYMDLVEFTSAIHWEMELDKNRFTYVSKQAEAILGYPASEWTDLEFWAGIIHPEDRPWAVDFCKDQVQKGQNHEFVYRAVASDGRVVWLRDISTLMFEEGRPKRLQGIMVDVTKSKQSEIKLRDALADKEVLFKEVHHRVKNNMAIISSLTSLQSSFVKNEEARRILLEGRNRIQSMALVHDMLYQSQDLAHVDIKNYIATLVRTLVDTYCTESPRPEIRLDVEPVGLDIDRLIPCAMIVNELVTNAFKYAYGSGGGVLGVRFTSIGGRFKLDVYDDGPGIPQGLDLRSGNTLGFLVVTSLAAQLEGTMEVSSDNGTKVSIIF